MIFAIIVNIIIFIIFVIYALLVSSKISELYNELSKENIRACYYEKKYLELKGEIYEQNSKANK